MAELLDEEQVQAALVELPAWTGNSTALARTVTAADFRGAIRIVDAVADEAEEMDHHPDIDIRWRTLTFGLTTHAAGGVTHRDVELAHRIDDIVAELAGL